MVSSISFADEWIQLGKNSTSQIYYNKNKSKIGSDGAEVVVKFTYLKSDPMYIDIRKQLNRDFSVITNDLVINCESHQYINYSTKVLGLRNEIIVNDTTQQNRGWSSPYKGSPMEFIVNKFCPK